MCGSNRPLCFVWWVGYPSWRFEWNKQDETHETDSCERCLTTGFNRRRSIKSNLMGKLCCLVRLATLLFCTAWTWFFQSVLKQREYYLHITLLTIVLKCISINTYFDYICRVKKRIQSIVFYWCIGCTQIEKYAKNVQGKKLLLSCVLKKLRNSSGIF